MNNVQKSYPLSPMQQGMLSHSRRASESGVYIGPREYQQLLVEWNDTRTDYPQDQCLHQLFESQVEQTPEAVAVSFNGDNLTYRELNRRANHLAHYLQRWGVGPEILVGVFMERSLELIISLYGILKAGGAYVPLDPEYPSERIAFMLGDTQVPVLLTLARLVDKLPSNGAKVLCVDSDWATIARERPDIPISDVTAENLAYIIYTSGSTGRPKGVMAHHRGMCNRLFWMRDTFRLTAKDRVLHKTPISSVVSVWELFCSSSVGGRLVVAQPGGHRDSAYLVKLIVEQQITTIHFVPSMLRAFLAEKQVERCQSLKRVVSSGEALPYELQKDFFARLEAELYNLYGQSETACDVTCWLCQRESALPIVPIGRPVANTQIYILDSQLQPVPVGVPGELYIGGIGMARGYLNRPELTKERFIPNPFSNEPEARLYRTGDLARYLADGNIEFLGRLDHQVKIRGHRIELGEIEAVLGQHPALKESVVVAYENGSGDKRLVVYVVPAQKQPVPASKLRSYLAEKLPGYMIPNLFVTLEALPLTPNGKVDRRSLPAPDWSTLEAETTFVAPRTAVEEVLAEIWVEILGPERVGIHDNFFELGGHSLLAMQVMSRLHNVFQMDLPLSHLFEAPTVAGLAERIEAAPRAARGGQIPPIKRASRTGKLPLSFAQQRLWFLDQLEGQNAAYNLSAAVGIMGPLDAAILEQCLTEITRRHEILRTTFDVIEGQPVQVIDPTLHPSLQRLDLRSLPISEREGQARRLMTNEAQQPFDLARGPLARFRLFQLDAKEHLFLVTMHHSISDVWSLRIFFRELGVLYDAFAAGKPSPLPELPIQYADYAVWQREWLQGEALEAQLNYWNEQLAGMPAQLKLPTDRPRPLVQTFRGGTVHFEFTSELTGKLEALARQSGATLYMSLLGAFAALLSFYSGQEDIAVGTSVAHRSPKETETLVGFFVNTLVMRIDLSGHPPVREILARVRRIAVNAFDHQSLPYDKLVEELQPRRNLNHSLLFRTFFVLQNVVFEKVKLASLVMSPLEIDSFAAMFDLMLLMEKTEHGLKGVLIYKRDLFEAVTIERMAGRFRALVENMVKEPNTPLIDLQFNEKLPDLPPITKIQTRVAPTVESS